MSVLTYPASPAVVAADPIGRRWVGSWIFAGGVLMLAALWLLPGPDALRVLRPNWGMPALVLAWYGLWMPLGATALWALGRWVRPQCKTLPTKLGCILVTRALVIVQAGFALMVAYVLISWAYNVVDNVVAGVPVGETEMQVLLRERRQSNRPIAIADKYQVYGISPQYAAYQQSLRDNTRKGGAAGQETAYLNRQTQAFTPQWGLIDWGRTLELSFPRQFVNLRPTKDSKR